MKIRNLVMAGLAGFGLWQWGRDRERSHVVSLKNKVVLITGASSGIGRACATVFAAQGAHTVLLARRANVLAEVQQELQAAFDTNVLTIATDITNEDDIQAAVDNAIDVFGRIDVLVNNAGIVQGGYLENKEFAAWQKIIDTNLSGLVQITQTVLPIMKAQHSGHIVNVGSVVSFTGTPGNAVYVATKSALQGFSDALRREVFSSNIKVSHVMPGFTETPMTAAVVEKMPDMPEVDALANMESADFVASHIVAAVRYNKRDVILGGMPMKVINWLYRLSPTLIDLIYTRIVDPDQIVKSVTD